MKNFMVVFFLLSCLVGCGKQKSAPVVPTAAQAKVTPKTFRLPLPQTPVLAPSFQTPVPLPGGGVWNFELEHPCGPDNPANPTSNKACDNAYPRKYSNGQPSRTPKGPPDCAPLAQLCKKFGQPTLTNPQQREGRNQWVQKCFSHFQSVIGALQQAAQARSSTNTACGEYVTLGRVHNGAAVYWDAPTEVEESCDDIPLDVVPIYGCTVAKDPSVADVAPLASGFNQVGN